MASAVRKGINDWRTPVARKLISSEVDSISPDSQSLLSLQFLLQEGRRVQDYQV
jgi:hypothetical protein